MTSKCAKCECFYCGVGLSGQRHEHDHAPIPARHDGVDTVPACMECHTLKDRTPLSHWSVAQMVEALEQCGPLGRIYLAKAMAVVQDARAELTPQAALGAPPAEVG